MTTKATTAFSKVPKFQEANEIIVFLVFRNLRKRKKFSKISPKKFPFHSTCNLQKNSRFNGLPKRLRNRFQMNFDHFCYPFALVKNVSGKFGSRKTKQKLCICIAHLNASLWLRREISSIMLLNNVNKRKVYGYSSSGKFAYN